MYITGEIQALFLNWYRLKKSVSQKGAECFCWRLYIVTAVHSFCFHENEANVLPCSDSIDVQFEVYKKLEVGDDFDAVEEKLI